MAGGGFDAFRAIWSRLRAGEGRLTVLTGAGVSTESGVPDFRSLDSPWRRHPPISYAAFMSDPATRAEAWRRKFAMDDLWTGARPGRSHRALAQLADRGILGTLITQNIDGLDRAAGLAADRIVELHGNGTFARCLSCHRRFELPAVRRHLDATGEALDCDCGGHVKSATIAFGQPLDPAVLAAALDATRDCAVFLAVGSSLVVRPAAQLPVLGKQAGASLVIVNREETPLDGLADVALRVDAGDALSTVACWH